MQGSQVFMDSFQIQAGGGAGGGGASLPGGSTYQALKVDTADACDTACDVEPLWGAWGGGMGAFGTVAGDSNSHGLTYNLGGFIAGLDRKFVPGFRAGVAAGFNAATLYTQGMPGTGTSNTLQFALYGEYAPGPFYLDALAGYGHSDNRMNRPIVIPGLPFRMAQGYTTANTFFGQLEAGYKIPVAPSFGGFVTPFARLQASTSTQAGFSETGADSLEPHGRAADDAVAAHGAGRAARRGHRRAVAREARPRLPAGLEPRVRRPHAAGDRGVRRRAGARRSPPSAPRRRATAWCSASAPRRRSPSTPASISATTAILPAATPTTC